MASWTRVGNQEAFETESRPVTSTAGGKKPCDRKRLSICSVKVSGQESVAALKKLVSQQLQVPEEQQHLLFRGQLLADDKCLSDYCIGPNASINVIVRPLEKVELENAPQPQPLWQQLDRVLAKHFGPQDAKAVLQLLRQEHEGHLQRVSLQDLEQLAQSLLAEQWCAEMAREQSLRSWPQGSCDTQEQKEKEKEEKEAETAAKAEEESANL